MVNTGAPTSSTGECVTQVAEHFEKTNIGDDFAQVTQHIQGAIQLPGNEELIYSIKENHKLLTKIGVVPNNIGQMIGSIESIGGAAKICGAGAVIGSNAGALLVVGEQGQLSDVVSKYGYKLETFDVDVLGTHVI